MEADTVVVIVAKEQEPECIICLQPDNLVVNTRCSCIYNYHIECLKQTERPTICLLCNKCVDGKQISQGIQTDGVSADLIRPQTSVCSCICCGVIALIVPAVWIGVNLGILK
jgi:hypothetical protein